MFFKAVLSIILVLGASGQQHKNRTQLSEVLEGPNKLVTGNKQWQQVSENHGYRNTSDHDENLIEVLARSFQRRFIEFERHWQLLEHRLEELEHRLEYGLGDLKLHLQALEQYIFIYHPASERLTMVSGGRWNGSSDVNKRPSLWKRRSINDNERQLPKVSGGRGKRSSDDNERQLPKVSGGRGKRSSDDN